MRALLILLAMMSLVMGQAVPWDYRLPKTLIDSTLSYISDSSSYSGLGSNSMVDIVPVSDSLVFIGTSGGLSVSPDLGATFRSYDAERLELPEGAVTALAASGGLVAWAGIRDTLVRGAYEDLGAGLAYSLDTGNTWLTMAPPMDVASDADGFTTFTWGDTALNMLAVTTPINNITWDMSIGMGTLWTASWTAGLRRYDTDTRRWQIIAVPMDDDTTLSCDYIPDDYALNPRDPDNGGNHNHKGFSVITYDNIVWFGTAAGINRGVVDTLTGCISWTHFRHPWDNLSGNWIVALHRQQRPGGDRIWAATVSTGDPGQINGASYTDDDGRTWQTTLQYKRIHNISSFGEIVYVASDQGLFRSLDGYNWAEYPSAVDSVTGEQVWSEVAHGVLYDARDSTLWVATPDGLGRTHNSGVSWSIERTFVTEDDFYAYPNPFYVNSHNVRDNVGHARFQYTIPAGDEGASATIVIYDFYMNEVRQLDKRYHGLSGSFSQVWDGRRSNGFPVANGVYYCRLILSSGEKWTKIMVIN